jgi:hypothetical protein
MKRFISILGLALGVTASSYATLINTVGGPAVGSNLASAGAALITFDEDAYPIGAFTSLPFSVTVGGNTFTGTFTWLNTTGQTCTGSGAFCGSVYAADTDGGIAGTTKPSGNERISNYDWTQTTLGSTGVRANYANTLRLTFTSGNVNEFGILIRNNDSAASPGGTANNALNYMVVNFTGGGSATPNQNLPNQYGNTAASNFFGWNANAGQTIASVDFVITGFDAGATRALDIVTFDDLRIFSDSVGSTTGGGGTTTSGGGGVIPEPSTYALMGAGLAALAYARRRR